MVNAREKGATAEREVAALLKAWWDPYEPGCQFVRTPGSGGWGTPQLRGEFEAAGDLMTTSKHFPFGMEVKRREGWSLDRVAAGKPSPVWGWWRQCQKAAEEMGKVPCLWFRKSKEGWFVMLPAGWKPASPVPLSPLFAFAPAELAGVDYGSSLPVIYPAWMVLLWKPESCSSAKPRRGRRKASPPSPAGRADS